MITYSAKSLLKFRKPPPRPAPLSPAGTQPGSLFAFQKEIRAFGAAERHRQGWGGGGSGRDRM
jgi:hypothetical protein